MIKINTIIKSNMLKSQFIELYADYLWDLFLWKYKKLYSELFLDFINFSISGDLLKELKMDSQVGTNFSVDSKAFNFSRIISQVYVCFG